VEGRFSSQKNGPSCDGPFFQNSSDLTDSDVSFHSDDN